jgi:ABC-type nitrate/sulfonate/bicarbonate transport system ATPase subunit
VTRATATAAVEIRGVTHAFDGDPPVAVLDDVSLRVERGQFVSLVGPSGCGKSTLLRMLAGLLAPDTGDATVDGDAVIGRPGRVAFMPQRDLLLPWRRALANATLGAQVAGVGGAEARARAEALFDRFGLAGFERAWPAQLSGGMRQRVSFLRTLLAGKPVLALDEPFAALDAITRSEMQGWLSQVLTSEPRTVVLVTHDVEEAVVLADRVVVMSARPGRVVAEIPVEVPRPRRRVDPAIVELREQALEALGVRP